jgi:phosphate/sulfate permease
MPQHWCNPVVCNRALGLGTMVGWKRIAVTVGEKIGRIT